MAKSKKGIIILSICMCALLPLLASAAGGYVAVSIASNQTYASTPSIGSSTQAEFYGRNEANSGNALYLERFAAWEGPFPYTKEGENFITVGHSVTVTETQSRSSYFYAGLNPSGADAAGAIGYARVTLK